MIFDYFAKTLEQILKICLSCNVLLEKLDLSHFIIGFLL